MCAYIVPLYGNIPAHGSIQLPFSWSLELRTNTSSDSGRLKRTNTSCNIANKIFCDRPDFREVPGAELLPLTGQGCAAPGGRRLRVSKSTVKCPSLCSGLFLTGCSLGCSRFLFSCLPNYLWGFSPHYCCFFLFCVHRRHRRGKKLASSPFHCWLYKLNYNWLHNIPLYHCAMMSPVPPKRIII